MLFKLKTLSKIKSGDVTMAFRKWKKPTIKQGGTLKTPIGLLAIDEISVVKTVSDKELVQAGYLDRLDLKMNF